MSDVRSSGASQVEVAIAITTALGPIAGGIVSTPLSFWLQKWCISHNISDLEDGLSSATQVTDSMGIRLGNLEMFAAF